MTMIYNPKKSVLIFQKNGKEQGVIENIHASDALSYRLCVYMGWLGNQIVELLE